MQQPRQFLAYSRLVVVGKSNWCI